RWLPFTPRPHPARQALQSSQRLALLFLICSAPGWTRPRLMLSLMLVGWGRPGPLPRWAHISQVLPHLTVAASAELLLMSAAKIPTAKANITLRILYPLLSVFSFFTNACHGARR